MTLRWSPTPHGLGPPLDVALLAPWTRARLARGWWPTHAVATRLLDIGWPALR